MGKTKGLDMFSATIGVCFAAFFALLLSHSKFSNHRQNYYDSLYNPQDTNSFFYHSKIKTKMKRTKIVAPKSEANNIAKALAENGIVTNLSWVQDGGGFFSQEIHIYITFPEDKSDRVIALFGKYIKDEK